MFRENLEDIFSPPPFIPYPKGLPVVSLPAVARLTGSLWSTRGRGFWAANTGKIVGSLRRPDTTNDSQDKGYIYYVNIVNVTDGSFDLLVTCTDWGFDDVTEDPPNETISYDYQIF